MADQSSNSDLPPFTLRIVAGDGKMYYDVESSELRDPKPIDPLIRSLVEMNVQMAHVPYDDKDRVRFFGTFIVNLAAFNPGGAEDEERERERSPKQER
jgi:hypothetical protein